MSGETASMGPSPTGPEVTGPAIIDDGRELTVGPGHPAVRGRTGKGISIAVIDSGVHPGHMHVGGIVGGIAFDAEGEPHGDVLDRIGHGTPVVGAIHERAPDAEIYMARVFEKQLGTTIRAFLCAFDWAIAREVRLINLSLGSVKPAHRRMLMEAAARARDAGILVVSAARGEDGDPMYPGCLPGVAGVTPDPHCPRDTFRIGPDTDGRPILLASPYPRPLPGFRPEQNKSGVSFAVANATGSLALVLEGRPAVCTVEDLMGLLAVPPEA